MANIIKTSCAIVPPERVGKGEIFPSGWFGKLFDWIKANRPIPDNKTIFGTPTVNGIILSAAKSTSSTGSEGSETAGYFTVIDVSETDPATGITTPKVAVVDSNQANPLTAQYCGQVHMRFELPVNTVTSLKCAQKVRPLTDPETYQPYTVLGGYVVWGMDNRTGGAKMFIEFEGWAERLWDIDIMNGNNVQRLRLAKVTLQRTVINEQESWTIKELIQLHTGYIFAYAPPVQVIGAFKAVDVYPTDFDPITYVPPAEGEDRTVRIEHGYNPNYAHCGRIFVGGQEIYVTKTEITFPEVGNGLTRIYIKIFWDEATELYDYEFGFTNATPIPHEVGEVVVELATASINRPVGSRTEGDIDLRLLYWNYN